MPGFCIILSSASGTPRLKGRSLHFPPILKKYPSIQNLNETTDMVKKMTKIQDNLAATMFMRLFMARK